MYNGRKVGFAVIISIVHIALPSLFFFLIFFKLNPKSGTIETKGCPAFKLFKYICQHKFCTLKIVSLCICTDNPWTCLPRPWFEFCASLPTYYAIKNDVILQPFIYSLNKG